MQYIDFLKRFNCLVKYHQNSLSHFKSGGKIRYVLYPEDTQFVKNILHELDTLSISYVVVGNCSNILISDKGYSGALVCTKRLNRMACIEDCIYAESGCNLSDIIILAKEHGLAGLEEFYGIPGTIGGAVCMNAGAFQREISQVVEYVDVVCNGKIDRKTCNELCFDYRYSIVKEQSITILGVMLKLKKDSKLSIQARMSRFMQMRKNMQPSQISLGSVFKKVNGISAGYYIEQVGLKGYKIGGAMISNKHANFIINVDHAKSLDFMSLANLAISKVDNAFNIRLQYEILLL